MVKVVEFKNRAIERLEQYRENPGALKALAYARYASTKTQWEYRGGRPAATKAAHAFIPFNMRKHKPHQMHEQHRDSCIRLLSFLIKRLDVKSRKCLFVNPSRKIVRTLYVPEMARATGLCERTITRTLGSLVKARYLIRIADQFILTGNLFRDLNLSVTLERLTKQLMGLETSRAYRDKTALKANNKKPPATPSVPSVPAAEPTPAQKSKPSEADIARAITARDQAMSLLPARMRKRPPPN